MVLEGITMVAGNTSRSKIYLQAMINAEMYPEKCIVYVEKSHDAKVAKKQEYAGMEICNIDLSESVVEILERADIPFEIIEEKDINSSKMIEAIRSLPGKYVIYSGYGGAILKSPLFGIGKKYLHIHAGILPKFRGSTTAYYSILRESQIGATAIFLNEEIDKGDILYQKAFPLPDFVVDIDYVYEPWTRAKVLVEVLKKYVDNDYMFEAQEQSDEAAEIYYIIHPVLKHLAMKKVELAQEGLL